MTQAQEVNGRMLDVAPAQAQALAGQGAELHARLITLFAPRRIDLVLARQLLRVRQQDEQLARLLVEFLLLVDRQVLNG